MSSVSDTVAGNARPALVRTDLPLPGRVEGKVRDIYRIPGDSGPPRLVIVATDRISSFDVVLPTPIPGKGRLLTEISVRWFDFIRDLNLIPDHLVSTDPADIPRLNESERARLEGRVMIGRAAEVIPIEFVVRGYLAGSGWREYEQRQSVCGVKLPAGLPRAGKLPGPIFTPTTKATAGHDQPLDYGLACELAPRDVVDRLSDVAVKIYTAAAGYALSRGLILADTKFEFGYVLDAGGRPTDALILIDEVLSPDSSRYWPVESYQRGREQENFDKQYVRNHLEELVDAGRWNKSPPGPALSEEVVDNTLARYVEARNRLFGRP